MLAVLQLQMAVLVIWTNNYFSQNSLKVMSITSWMIWGLRNSVFRIYRSLRIYTIYNLIVLLYIWNYPVSKKSAKKEKGIYSNVHGPNDYVRDQRKLRSRQNTFILHIYITFGYILTPQRI